MLLYLLFLVSVFCCAATLITLWLSTLVGFGIAKKRQSPEGARSAGKRLGWLSGLIFSCGIGLWFLFSPPAFVVYYSEFGEIPDSNVRDMQAASSFGFDGREAFLRFQTAPSNIQRLVQTQKMSAVAPADSKADEMANLAPSWWQSQPTLN